MDNPRRPKDSPIRVVAGTDRDTRQCKAFASTEDFTYSKSEDYKQRKALGMDTPTPDLKQTDAKQDKLLLEALNNDLHKRNIH